MGVNCAFEIAETLPQRITIKNIITGILKICFIDNPKALIDLICITMGIECEENRLLYQNKSLRNQFCEAVSLKCARK
jgi:hypothetical protein